jgi:Tfp pilus assembly protein PilX
MKTSTDRPGRQGERGVALALALFAMAAMMVGATSALFIGADDIRASRNYRGAAQAHFAAESGLTRAVQAINSVGVIDFKNEIWKRACA